MKKIIGTKYPIDTISVSELPGDINSKIIIIKYLDEYGFLSQTNDLKYYYKCLNSISNRWTHDYPSLMKAIEDFINNDKYEFFLFDSMEEFASWFDEEINHTISI